MGYNQAYNAYRDTNVKTASQGRLIVLLYEGAVKQLTLANSMFDENGKLPVRSIEAFGKAILKAQEIITELQVSLDMEKGGEIAKNLMSLYIFFNKELTETNISKDQKRLEPIMKMISDLCESWRQAAASSANAPQTQVQQTLNIQGQFMSEISQEELNERVALLKKFRSLLIQQRAKFQEYLTVLEKQENSIETENSENLLAHTELEQQIVANIMNLQKVIVPMSELYKERGAHLEEESVTSIQKELDNLQKQVLVQNERNRELLKNHIVQIRTQIASLKNPYKNNRSVYEKKETVGKLVAVEA